MTRRLTGLEQGFLGHEIRTRTGNLQIGGLTVFDGPAPGLADFRAAVVPRLREFAGLHRALSVSGTARWLDWDPAGLHTQVFEWECAPGEVLASAVDGIMVRRLTAGAPPWQLWLIHGLDDGSWAAIFKAHHALLDGASMVRVLHGILGGAGKRVPRESRRPRDRGTDLRVVARGAARYFARFLPPARPAFTRLRHQKTRRHHWVTVDAEVLHRAAAHHGVTINDIYLAALATALREWPHTPWRGGVPRPVWTLVPVDPRSRDGDTELGASVVHLRVKLPCGEPDPARRLAAITSTTRTVKGSLHFAVAGAGARALPTWFVRAAFSLTFARWHIAFLASNVRGPAVVLDYGGQPLRELVPLGFLPAGHAFAAYLINQHDRFTAGFVLDESLTGGPELGDSWRRAVEELAAPAKPALKV